MMLSRICSRRVGLIKSLLYYFLTSITFRDNLLNRSASTLSIHRGFLLGFIFVYICVVRIKFLLIIHLDRTLFPLICHFYIYKWNRASVHRNLQNVSSCSPKWIYCDLFVIFITTTTVYRDFQNVSYPPERDLRNIYVSVRI